MRPDVAIAIIACALIPSPAPASCAAAQFDVRPQTARAGEALDIRGAGFIVGCDDVGGGNGCGAPERREVERPMKTVRFELRRDGKIVEAVQVPVDAGGSVRGALRVPADVAPGKYRVIWVWADIDRDRVPVRIEPAADG